MHQAERNRRILDDVASCKAIAIQIQRRLPADVELDDLIQAGMLGLMDAADKYEPSRQVEFSSYAKHRIRGAILDSLRELDFTSREVRRCSKMMDGVVSQLANRLQRDPMEEEVADHMGIPVGELQRLRFEMQCVRHVSTTFVNPADDVEGELEFPSEQHAPDRVCLQAETLAALGEAMKPLPPRHHRVVMDYYMGEKSMKEIGDELGISESRVCQLHKSALARMGTVLRASGVCSAAAF